MNFSFFYLIFTFSHLVTALKIIPDNPIIRKDSPDGLPDAPKLVNQFMCPREADPRIDDLDYVECRRIVQESLKIKHPHQNKITPEILDNYGYFHREYKVKTEDGYILTIYRITDSASRKARPTHDTPVFLNHGMIGSSDWWFFLPNHKSLPLKMADEGYDVWISNSRGTTYSLEHEKLNYEVDIDYWDFSFHEMGIYDVVSVTNLILAETQSQNLIYVGYSMATNAALISLSEVPSMNDKIRAAFLLAPAAHIGHSNNIIRNLCPLVDTEERYNLTATATRGRLRNNRETRILFGVASGKFCSVTAAKCGLCESFWFSAFGINAPQLNKTMFPFIYEKVPNLASVKTLAHFAQLIASCRFQQFDYYNAKNLELYASEEPPPYELHNIKTPIYMYHGKQDNFCSPKDIVETTKLLRKGVLKKLYLVKDDLFNHLDFSMAKDADKLVYKEVLSDMRKYRDNA